MPETINRDRRRLLGASIATIAAAPVLKAKAAGSAFGPLQQIDAGVLKVGYAEALPKAGAAGRKTSGLSAPGRGETCRGSRVTMKLGPSGSCSRPFCQRRCQQ